MENNRVKFGFGLSVATTAILSAILVVAKEMNTVLKGWMKEFTGHHWVTHGILMLVFFLVLGFILTKYKADESLKLNDQRMSLIVGGGTLLSAIIIAGFYLFH
ncbi:MAG: hypothetical protein H8E64_01180 [Candidatus Marinimicrobia bacterium]|nr:hypothetical protein [Candidatus Neomarinimicrobiota bacterium]